ncbi:hypothetical protein CEUSTIGMA_g4631.t1 [Chlamydomonas eustigma]|uniref:Uncharacterized protein n=1 Tax=Chlamydomonas eustigma TaxID=1157962 RepID=A0A250X2A7_9CHLO|nr:hypothetical protein CEUSTIGMA_g4631.t1 [Chlamydomonas eustigma]|eukprot:GAX77185.1 hypothetical protein CEUSTIGMA_g4631.t1 [Chlamydomonas eustigma]
MHVMKYSPGVPERNHKYNDVIATVQMLVDLHTSGYKIGHIEEKTASHNMDSPLLPLKAITSMNLKYDMKDAQLFKAGQLGCPLPQELEPTMGRCGAVPEQINPRSLRSDLGHNTNIWAAKTGLLMQTNGTVGVLKLGDHADTYFIPKGSDWGMGMRRCSDMDPKWQVRHRCPCTNPVVCGAEEELYKRLASEGKLAHNYIIPDDS